MFHLLLDVLESGVKSLKFLLHHCEHVRGDNAVVRVSFDDSREKLGRLVIVLADLEFFDCLLLDVVQCRI